MTSIPTEQENHGMTELTLAAVDADGAIGEATEALPDGTRGDFLRKAGAVGGGLTGGGLLLALNSGTAAAATSKGDIAILNFALTLEYLEAAFYAEAVRKGVLKGEVARFAREVAGHEKAHVVTLKQVLGRKAVARPSFDFQGTTGSRAKFIATATVLEDTGVKAYKGQAPRIKSDAILKAALAIHTVEARHASWIRHIAGKAPAPAAFDPALTKQQVLAAVTKTGFITR
jgi:rubrerythrin